MLIILIASRGHKWYHLKSPLSGAKLNFKKSVGNHGFALPPSPFEVKQEGLRAARCRRPLARCLPPAPVQNQTRRFFSSRNRFGPLFPTVDFGRILARGLSVRANGKPLFVIPWLFKQTITTSANRAIGVCFRVNFTGYILCYTALHLWSLWSDIWRRAMRMKFPAACP